MITFINSIPPTFAFDLGVACGALIGAVSASVVFIVGMLRVL